MLRLDWLSRTRHRAAAAAAAVLTVAVVATPAVAAPAFADAPATYPIGWAPIGIYPRSDTVWASAHVGPAIPNGGPVQVECEADGQAVSSAAGTSTIWDRLASPAGAWIPNVFLATGAASWTPGVPRCRDLDATRATQQHIADLSSSEGRYNRQGAATWAADNALTFPHKYPQNCTWFQSHAAWLGGGLPQTSSWTDSSHNFFDLTNRSGLFRGGPTKAATLADAFKNELTNDGYGTLSGELDTDTPVIEGAKLGDYIGWDWDPNNTADGRIDHWFIITGFDANGAPLVSGQTNDVVNQRWQYTHDGQLIKDTKTIARAYLLHITW